MRTILSAEPFILIYSIVFTMHTATLPQLLLKKTCLKRYNNTVCGNLDSKRYSSEQDYAHEQSSIWMMILIGAGLLPSILTILIWGPLSDKWGRKKTMLIPSVCLALQSLAYLWNSAYMSAHPAFLLFGAMITSFYGEFQGAVAISYSYMADVTPKDSARTLRMAIIEGMIFFSGAPAGLITGIMLEKVGFPALFLTTTVLNLVNFLYVLIVLPAVPPSSRRESCSSQTPILSEGAEYGRHEYASGLDDKAESLDNLPNTEVRTQVSGTQSTPEIAQSCETISSEIAEESNLLNPLVHLREAFHLIFDRRLRGTLLPYILAFGFSVMAFTGELYISVLYIKHQPLNLSAEEVGYYQAAQAAIRGLGVIFISQFAVRCCKLSDFQLVSIGLLSQCINYVLIGFSKTKLMLYLVTLPGVTMPLATSSLRSIITKQVDSSKHGTVLSAIEAMDVIGSLLSNTIVNVVYFGSVASHVGAAFYVLASFALMSFIIVCITSVKRYHFS